jgi:predicted nucleic acid-binding protein
VNVPNITFPVSVRDALRGVRRLALDTAPIIYFVEAHPGYFPLCEAVFRAVSAGTIRACTSDLTRTEVLTLPLRNGDTGLADIYRALLSPPSELEALPVDAAVAETAADLRARYGLKTPDALQVATAITAGCEAFLTGDKGLRRVTEVRVLVLDDLTL